MTTIESQILTRKSEGPKRQKKIEIAKKIKIWVDESCHNNAL